MRIGGTWFIFAMSALAGWLLAAQLGLGPEPRVAGAASAVGDGAALLAQGDQALRRDDLNVASSNYRRAWRDPTTRHAASERLQHVSRRRDWETPVDEQALSKTLGVLGPGFVRSETDRFVILSDAAPSWTRRRAQLLERTYHQYFRVMERIEFPATPPEHKLLCVLFERHDAYRRFAKKHDGVEATWIAGYYAGLSNRIVFYDDRTSPHYSEAIRRLDAYKSDVRAARDRARQASRERNQELAGQLAARAEDLDRRISLERSRIAEQADASSEAKTIHEAVHLLAFNTGLQSRTRQYPFWLTEGLACAFETDNPSAAFGPDHETSVRERSFAELLQSGALIDLQDLVSFTHVPDGSAATADVMYAMSYALVAYLHRYERRGLGRIFLNFLEQPAGVSAPDRLSEQFEDAFGRIDAFERRWLTRVAN